MKQYTDVNNKLPMDLKITNVIVDLSKVLKNYHYFWMKEELLQSMDKTYDDKSNTINNLKSLQTELYTN